MTEPVHHEKTPAKATIASWVGTTLEYYGLITNEGVAGV